MKIESSQFPLFTYLFWLATLCDPTLSKTFFLCILTYSRQLSPQDSEQHPEVYTELYFCLHCAQVATLQSFSFLA